MYITNILHSKNLLTPIDCVKSVPKILEMLKFMVSSGLVSLIYQFARDEKIDLDEHLEDLITSLKEAIIRVQGQPQQSLNLHSKVSKVLRTFSHLFERYPKSKKIGQNHINIEMIKYLLHPPSLEQQTGNYITVVKSMAEILILLEFHTGLDLMSSEIIDFHSIFNIMLSQMQCALVKTNDTIGLSAFSLFLDIYSSQILFISSNIDIESASTNFCFNVKLFIKFLDIFTDESAFCKVKWKTIKILVILLSSKWTSEAVLQEFESMPTIELDPLIRAMGSPLEKSTDDNLTSIFSLIALLFESKIMRTRLVDRGLLKGMIKIEYIGRLSTLHSPRDRKIAYLWLKCIDMAGSDSAIRYRMKIADLDPFIDNPGLISSDNKVNVNGIIPLL